MQERSTCYDIERIEFEKRTLCQTDVAAGWDVPRFGFGRQAQDQRS
jgi:hypothetical protein